MPTGDVGVDLAAWTCGGTAVDASTIHTFGGCCSCGIVEVSIIVLR